MTDRYNDWEFYDLGQDPDNLSRILIALHPSGRFCRVQGNSMFPTLKPGDRVLVDSTLPLDGDIVVVKFRERGEIIGRFRTNGSRSWLEKDNPEHSYTLLITPADQIIGPVIYS